MDGPVSIRRGFEAAMATSTDTEIETINDALSHYAARGVFRGFGALGMKSGKARYRIKWHYESDLILTYDPKTNTIRFPNLFPNVDSDEAMYTALRAYLKKRLDQVLPDHRRIDEARVKVSLTKRNGVASLSFKSLDGDLEYATKKLVHLVHEMFIDFLRDGPYYDYLVAEFGAEADPM